jgi:hypothetical protein
MERNRRCCVVFGEEQMMKAIIIGSAAIALALAVVGMPASAEAKGCIMGAFVGGVAGHYTVHHGILGAAAGCIIGHHEANKAARQNRDAQRRPAPDSINSAH